MNKNDKLTIKNNLKDNDFISEEDYTPLRKNAFKLNSKKKIRLIEFYFNKIMETLGLDMNDDSLKNTPIRVAKMYINEIFEGLNPDIKPSLSTFENKYKYNQMLVERNIVVYSTCEHHFLPIIGKAHVGYISNGNVIGLSKINRIVNYFCKRPQVQERLTIQIVNFLKKVLKTKNVACIIDAKHLCVNSRGIRDFCSSTLTTQLCGLFKIDMNIKEEFLHYTNINLID